MTAPSQCPITGSESTLFSTKAENLCKVKLPGPIFVRLALWLAVFAVFPLSGTAVLFSFNLEVLGRTTFPAALPPESGQQLGRTERVLLYLERAERAEINPWYRDDIRIAWITAKWAFYGVPEWAWGSTPHAAATQQVLKCQPDQVWAKITARRKAMLAAEYENFFPNKFALTGADAPPTSQRVSNFVGEVSAKKPCAKVRTSERRAA